MSKDKPRCVWCGDDPLYVAYHDNEWGQPLHDDRLLFEHICLEGFQAGLSWITVLRKREAFRKSFHNFDPKRVVTMTESDVDRLCKDASIIRNRAKIRSTINNAKRTLQAQQEHGSLDALLWSFAPKTPAPRPATDAEIPVTTPESHALSKHLKSIGWSFVGPTGIYAFMQSAGLVNDHVATCHYSK